MSVKNSIFDLEKAKKGKTKKKLSFTIGCDTKREKRLKLTLGSKQSRDFIASSYPGSLTSDKPVIIDNFSISEGSCAYINDLNDDQLRDVSYLHYDSTVRYT